MRHWLSLIFSIFFFSAYCQQDVDFHLVGTFLTGKNILKVKRDFHDPYLWVLAQNNEVYRINSITKVIDDYTSQFSAYSSMQFIDIAGRSLDTVFIATNSTNVIEYKKGIFKVINSADGIVGVVNSIGIDYTGTYTTNNVSGLSSRPTANTLLIATGSGMCHYDYQNEIIPTGSSHVPARVFETTYRSEMYSDVEYGPWCNNCDTVLSYPVIELNLTIFGGWLWYGNRGKFGNTINTAFYTEGIITDKFYNTSGQASFMNQYWGTENGLFQNSRNYSYSSMWGYKSYLTGIKVNKITSIYGLRAFGNSYSPGLLKENLLVGTDQGLYFSSSGYHNFSLGMFNKYTFFHLNDLGSKIINDICVNATSYNTPICEDGAWVAATDGLYLITPNYGPYINAAQQIQAIQFNGQPFNVSQLQTCSNTSVEADVSPYAFEGNSIQWYKNGQALSGETNTKLFITSSGDYNAVLYDPCSPVYFSSNHLTVTVISAPAFTFNYADTVNYCDGSTATLKTDNNAAYQYRWYKNGVLNGNTTYTMNTSLSGKYKVEVSACQGNSWVASKEVQVNFVKVPQPIVIADKAAYCAGDQATLSTTVPIDASQIINWAPYSYRWYKDGVLNGKTTAAIAVTQPGKYKVEVTSCSGTWVASTETTVAFITLTKPILVADKPAYCFGDQATLSINFINDGTYTVNWYRDGNIVNTNQNKTTLSSNQAGNYTVSITSNLTTCSLTSDAFALNFNALPTISIQQVVNTTLCDGEPVSLNATFVSGNIKWSTGETTNSITVKHSGTYTATATTVAGCSSAQNINIDFLPNPKLSMRDATLCQFTNENITLTAPIGFKKYEWNGQSGTSSFITGKLGIVNLVVTDNNGCKASKTITISSHCKDIHVPNTFTLNGDGINDTWVISGLENDLSTTVKVYNRFGELMFQSQGYAIAWNGAVNNKNYLPENIITSLAPAILSRS